MRNLPFVFLIIILFSCNQPKERFELIQPKHSGITFFNEIIEKDSFNILHNEYMYNGGGVGVADLNNDGLMDLIFTGNKVSSKIYLNQGNFKFKDITNSFENLSNNQWISGVSIADINADGLQDIYFTSTSSKIAANRRNQLWVNQGINEQGVPAFKEMAVEYGIADEGYSVHSVFFDYDLDGYLDLYILNNIVGKDIPTNYRPKIIDGSSPNNDKLYRNLGNGKFIEVSKEAGITYEGFGLGLAVSDFNQDGYPDLYISNDYVANDLLFINQKDGTFKNSISEVLSYQSKFSMGNDVSDMNNDGLPDIMTVDMLPENYYRKKQTINGNSYFIKTHDEKYGYEPQYVRNMLHIHNGIIHDKIIPFSEIGQMAGIYQTEWSWAPLFADFDNDGDKDLFITNGYPKDLTDKDFTNYKAQMYNYLASDWDILGRIPVVKVPNYAYENLGNNKFKNVTKDWGMNIPSFSNGAAFVDLDNDGFLDYVTNNINDNAFIYRNLGNGSETSSSNYLRIELTGKKPNTNALGTKIRLWTNNQLQYYQHFLSRGYISSMDPIVHFGLGENTIVDSIEIVWPLGSTYKLYNITPNQIIHLKEDSLTSEVMNDVNIAGNDPLFVMNDSMLQYQHIQEDYVDFFQNQRIIHHKFSQIGPAMDIGDLTGDGENEIIVSGGPSIMTTVFSKVNGEFEKIIIPGLTEIKICEEADIRIIDIDNDGDYDVVVASGGYANEEIQDYQHYLYRNNQGVFVKELLPVPAFTASVIVPIDFNNDGYFDLFIGSRVNRGKYPSAGPSYLLMNNAGEFNDESLIELDLGMVTDATVTDFDGDGWKDLVISRDWNSIVFLKNEAGNQLTPLDNVKINEKTGFWKTVVAGDLNGDGLDDYVLGNLGENHRFNVSDEFPMRVYAVDIDENGDIDPIISAYWPDENGSMEEFPVNYLDELAAQSPFFRKKFTSYTHFSNCTMDSIIDKSSLDNNQIMQVNTTGNYILWNEGNGKFKWEKLTDELQVSPIKSILIQDINSDGNSDIILAGNDHSYDISTGIYDASLGHVLLGNGNGVFEVLPPTKSGIYTKGQVESLLYLKDEGVLIFGRNRDKISLFQNINIEKEFNNESQKKIQ